MDTDFFSQEKLQDLSPPYLYYKKGDREFPEKKKLIKKRNVETYMCLKK